MRDVALDQPDLVDVRERQIGRGGQDTDRAAGLAAVSDVDVLQVGRGVGPGQRVEGVEQGPAVLLDREHELAAVVVDQFGGRPGGVQRVRGDGHAWQVEGLQQGAGGGRLRGPGAVGRRLGEHDAHRSRSRVSGESGQQVQLVPVVADGAAHGLAVEP
ncbi:hypothetical protein [Micromonospora sp. LOL_015]|uniref:hypothetical protein n=1 Tax=Micromonospora sp. LOL_015 TaxID=3345416 RepID=UPI003A893C51